MLSHSGGGGNLKGVVGTLFKGVGCSRFNMAIPASVLTQGLAVALALERTFFLGPDILLALDKAPLLVFTARLLALELAGLASLVALVLAMLTLDLALAGLTLVNAMTGAKIACFVTVVFGIGACPSARILAGNARLRARVTAGLAVTLARRVHDVAEFSARWGKYGGED